MTEICWPVKSVDHSDTHINKPHMIVNHMHDGHISNNSITVIEKKRTEKVYKDGIKSDSLTLKYENLYISRFLVRHNCLTHHDVHMMITDAELRKKS